MVLVITFSLQGFYKKQSGAAKASCTPQEAEPAVAPTVTRCTV